MSVLSIGPSADTITGNRVALDDNAAFGFSVMQVHVGNAQTPAGIEWGDYVRDAIQRGNQAPAPMRQISFGLRVLGTPTQVSANLHTLQKMLQRARDSSKLSPLGAPIVLVFQPDGAVQEIYIDVLGGHIKPMDRAGKRGAKSTRGQAWTLLYAEKYRTRNKAMSREALLKQSFYVGENAQELNVVIHEWMKKDLFKDGQLQEAALKGVAITHNSYEVNHAVHDFMHPSLPKQRRQSIGQKYGARI